MSHVRMSVILIVKYLQGAAFVNCFDSSKMIRHCSGCRYGSRSTSSFKFCYAAADIWESDHAQSKMHSLMIFRDSFDVLVAEFDGCARTNPLRLPYTFTSIAQSGGCAFVLFLKT